MKRINLLSISSLAALALTACPPTYPKCNNDDGCKEHNEVCVQGQCQECATDQNCKEGFTCQQNRCQPKPVAAQTKNDDKSGCSADTDCAENQLCTHNQCVTITAGMSECGNARVHFGFNSIDLNPEELPLLQRAARCLRAVNGLHLTVDGNADERGTEEYNLHLSQRRAASVEKYLENLGVSQAQLKTIGYGYEKPICKEHDEDCWAKNRRAGLKPSQAAK